MNNKVTTRLLVIAVLTLGMVGSATAQTTTTDNSTVSVAIGTKTAIDISPSALDFGSIDPGSSAQWTGGAENFTHIELENIGSTNLTHIWLNASTPSSNPFGTGIAANYDVGNFVEVSPTGEIGGVSSDDDFTFVNRKEFNESNDLSYIFTPTNTNWRYGRFRVGSQEFFWAANTTGLGGPGCDVGDADTDDFRVGNLAHNETATGSNDFTDAAEYTPYELTSVSGNTALASGVWINSSVLSTDRQYDVLVNCDTSTWTMRTKYNIEAGAATDLSTNGQFAEYVLNATSATDSTALMPGEHFSVNVSIRVPLGTAQSGGNSISGVLRIFADNA